MKRFLLSAFVICAVMGVKAQQRTCGTTEYLQIMKQNFPEIEENRQSIETYTNDFVAAHANEKGTNAVITIPVVVHVVYQNSAENISDARVFSQIAVLNEDFRRLNADASNTPGAFAGVAADSEIEFCLATIDPSGNPTTGITRTSTNVSTFSIQSDNVKFTSQGGINAWPRNDYLNIWVCDLGNGLLGYAIPPGGPAAYDGVVIGYQYFGRNLGAQAPYNLGRTATHEVGHWLNLEHIWGDDGGSCSGSDQVSDTPNQAGENGGCPSFPRTDACSPNNPGVMFMNYMDYVNDNCMNLFTNGQKTRMRAALNGPRSSILSSTKCSGGGGGGTGSCDTVGNFTSGDQLIEYVVENNGGFVGGSNNYQDKSKAERFAGVPSNKIISKALMFFSEASGYTGSSKVTATIWSNSGVLPGSELANTDILLSAIAPSISGNTFHTVNFPSAIPAPSTFFCGIKVYYTDNSKVALYTSTDGDQVPPTAHEQFSDNSWHRFDESNSWQLDVSLAVFPVLCDVTLGTEEIMVPSVKIFPNPTTGMIQVLIPGNETTAQIRIFDMMGRLIQADVSNGDYNQQKYVDLSGQVDGIYFVEVIAGTHKTVEKIILRK